MEHQQSAAGAVGRVDVDVLVAERRDRPRATGEIDALLARVDLDAYADALLVAAEREVPTLAALDDDVRGRQVRGALRTLGALSVQTLGEGEAGTEPGSAFVDAITDVMLVWGLSVDDLAVVLSLSGTVFAEHLFRDLSGGQVLAVADRIGQDAGVLDLFGRIIASAASVRGGGDAARERRARERLAAALRHRAAEVPPVAGGRRCFVARIADAPLRAHAALAQALRDDGVDAATGSDHVLGVLAAGAPAPSVDGAVVVAEHQARDADADTRRRWLLEVADAAERIGVWGTLSDRDLIPYRLLIAAPRRRASLAARLGRVRDGGSAVLEAAEAFVRGGGVAAAANALGVHRETVRSRVKRAERLAGLDLATAGGRSILALSIVGSALGDAPADPPLAPPQGRAASAEPGVAPAVQRIDVDALTRRAVALLTRRARSAGPAGDVDEIDPARVRDGLREAMRLVRTDSPHPRLELTAESKRRLGQLTLGVPLADAHGAFAEVLTALGNALVDGAVGEETFALPRVIGRQWAFASVMHETIKMRWPAGGSRADALAELLDALVTGSAPRHVLASRAHAAGLDVDERYRALVVVFAERTTTAAAFAMTLRAAGWAAIACGREVQAVVAADVTDATLRTLLLDTCVACGSDVAALRDLGDAIPPLRRLVADADANGRRGLLDPEEEVVALLLLERPELAALLRDRVVGALASHDPARGVDLVATLTAYVDSGLRRGPTAEALHVHPNSVDYRLRTIEALTGLSFTDADDVLVLSLAVAAQRLAVRRHP